jgi:rRNA maturation RNase YbeY
LDSLEGSLPLITIEEGKELGDLTLIFCSDEELLTLNQEHLKHDYYTDIITFDYSTETYIAGDLFISIDRVLENSSVEKVPFDEELHRVVYHGLLHLLGYNDKNEEEIRTMRSKENYYLTKLFHVKH